MLIVAERINTTRKRIAQAVRERDADFIRREAIRQARQLGVGKVFALTLAPVFFEKLGFKAVKKDALPMKVWSDCAKCPKQQNCDETAVVYKIAKKGSTKRHKATMPLT